jgi:4-carboxymuconolactone decarboxylase
MTRIPSITNRDDVPADAHTVFDSIVASRGAVRGPFAVLMHSPVLAGRLADLGSFVRFESSLPPPIAQLAVSAAIRDCECAYEWATHVVSMRAAGIKDATIDVLRRNGDIDALSPEEQLPIRYARELVRDHRLTDETFAAMHRLIGDRGIAELTTAIGYYTLLACVLNGLEVPPAPDGDRLPAR